MAGQLQASAIIVLESPEGFVFEHRLNVPGIAHPDKLSLIGGLVNDKDPSPEAAMRREIVEETSLDPETMSIQALWRPQLRLVFIGPHPNVIRVNTFHGQVTEEPFQVHEAQGYEIFPRRVFEHRKSRPPRMTRFAFSATRRFLEERTS